MFSSGLFDSILTLLLSEGMLIFVAVLLVASIIVFVKSKKNKALRLGSIIVVLCCLVYIGIIIAVSIAFGAPHPPAPPAVPN